VSPLRFEFSFASAAELITAYEQELSKKGLLLRGLSAAPQQAMAGCVVALQVAGQKVIEFDAKVAAVIPSVGVAVMLDAVPLALTALVDRARVGAPLVVEASTATAADGATTPDATENDADAPTGPLAERLKALTVAEKIALALSCDRETRFALLRDHNKTLHVFVLRNPRLGLDEVQAAAKLASLSPDALKLIAEHREWGNNPTICTSLVRNPKLLMPLALRVLDRVPMSEVRAIAKGGARDQLVNAARKRLSS
jgi:hypothetical protein